LINAARKPRDIVTIGASAGGIEALLALLEKLPATLPATIAAVIHRPPMYESQLARLLDRRSTLTVLEPTDSEPVEAGKVYLAPRDHHMVFAESVIRLHRGPQQHRFRPAVDPLFLSAAEVYGPRVVGILLSGGGADGVRGLIGIKARGGLSLVQDPREARNPTMPKSAIADDDVDAVLRLDQIGEALVLLTAGSAIEAATC
jgi:two-component system, chemotaxis family, protein-glutamate methylesterase/glutaminase